MITLKTLPLSTNALYQGRRFLTKKGKENKEALTWEIKLAWGNKKPIAGSVKLLIDLYWGDMRRHDVDNIKTLLDCMSGIVYDDDTQVTQLHVWKHFDKEHPRVEIEVL